MKFNEYRIDLRKLFLLLTIFSALFAIFYRFYLKGLMLIYIKYLDEAIDIDYYLDIFEYGDFSLLIIFILLLLIYFLFKPIQIIIMKINPVKFLLLCLILNFSFQLSILLLVKTLPISDSIFYIEHGLRLAKTGKYITENGNYTAFWPVGIPAILAFLKILGLNEILFMKILNMFFSGLLLIILYLVFKGLLDKNEIKIFLIFYSLNPNNLFAVNPILSELPVTFLSWFCILLIIYCIRKKDIKMFFLIGLIAGATSLFKSGGLILIIFIVLFIIYEKEFIIKRLLLFTLGAFIVLSPWTYRNYKVFKAFVPTFTNGGFNFLMGNHYHSKGGLNFDFEYDYKNADEVGEEKKAYTTAINDIKKNPLRFLIRLPKKLFYSYYRSDHFVTWSLKKTENSINPLLKSFVFFTTNGLSYLIILLSILALVSRLNKMINLKTVKLILLFYLLNIILILIYVGSERYVYPLFPIHLFFAINVIDLGEN